MPAPEAAAPHAPEGGLARRLLGSLHVTGIFWYRLHLFAIRSIPEWMAPPIHYFATLFFWVALRRIRSAIASNLEAPLGRCGWIERQARIFRSFHEFAWCLTERYERLATKRPFEKFADGVEHWESLSAGSGGFILMTAHVGTWEVGAHIPGELQERLVHIVREDEQDPQARELVRGLVLASSGPRFITHFATDDAALGVELLAALRRGEVVALQGDRPRAGGRTIGTKLFGRPYPLPSGPMALARGAGVPILPVFALREGRRKFRACFRPPIFVSNDLDRTAAYEEAGQRIAADIEGAIRRAPHQWFCFRRLWDQEA